MHENFLCDCESAECFGVIRGFRYLSDDERLRLLPVLARHLYGHLRHEDVARAGAA